MATWQPFPSDQPGGRRSVPGGAPAPVVPGGTRLRSRAEEPREVGVVGSRRTSEVEATPLPPQPAGADAPCGPGPQPAFPRSQGLSGRDLRPRGLSGGLVTGSPGAPSRPPWPGRVLSLLPAPGQAVGPGPLGELSLGCAGKSLWGPEEADLLFF